MNLWGNNFLSITFSYSIFFGQELKQNLDLSKSNQEIIVK